MMIMMIMFLFMLMISMILLFLNFLISKKKNNNREKISPFECGFDPFMYARMPFSIQFYMISIIFLIFDIEVIILFPMIPSLTFLIMNKNLLMIMFFIIILLIGLFIEWKDGALKWLK